MAADSSRRSSTSPAKRTAKQASRSGTAPAKKAAASTKRASATTKRTAKKASATTKRTADQATKATKRTAKKASTATKRTADQATKTAKRTAEQTTKAAKRTADQATKATKPAAKQATTNAKRAVEEAARTTKRVAEQAAAATTAALEPTTTARRSGGRRGQDVIALLKADHQKVEGLFRRFEQLGDTAHKRRESTVAKMIEELSVHAAVEEAVVYPDARERFSKDDADVVLEALEEHHVVKWTLSELEKMRSTDERYTAKVTVLMEMVRHHVKEEEEEFFPKLRDAATPTELRDLADRLVGARRTAPTRPHPRSPDTPPGNIVAAALTAPLDVTAKVAEGIADRVRDIVS